MDSIIIPNWHPLLVHFTVGLVVTSSLFLVLSKVKGTWSTVFETVGKWTLWVGAGITVLTLLAGFDAYNTVAHDDIAHKVMKVHRTWALVTAAAILLLALWTYKAKTINSLVVAASLLVSGLVGYTGYLGAELVYRHGLGVMRLPDSSGEGHAHAGGESHDHGEAAPSSADGHDHGEAPSSADGHDHGEEPSSADGHDHGSGSGDDHHSDEAVETDAHDHGEVKAEAETKEGGHDHATPHDHGQSSADDTIDPAQVSESLFKALQTGDEVTVAALLADDVLILEGAHAQKSKMEYMSGHMKADMAFLPNIKHEVLSREKGQAGDVAWVTTHSRSTGSYKGKEVDRTSREFLLLRRHGSAWKVTLIQWADN